MLHNNPIIGFGN